MQQKAVAHDVVTSSAALAACERGHCWEDALRLWIRSSREWAVRPNVVAYGAAMSACSAVRRAWQVLCLFDQMKTDRLASDLIVCNMAVAACAECTTT